jgi:hypothetical protein
MSYVVQWELKGPVGTAAQVMLKERADSEYA